MLKKGSKGEAVVALQKKLNQLGYIKIKADGDFGPKTELALKSFQTSQKLPVTGVFDSATEMALDSLFQVIPTVPDVFGVPSFTIKSPRKLELELEKMLDKTLTLHMPQEFKIAYDAKDANKIVWMANKALEILKIREATNNNDGHDVVLIQETIGGHANEPWCMAEQQSCIAYAEKKTGVVSKVIGSESCMDTFTETDKLLHIPIFSLQMGDIWIWRHGTSWKGHTGNFERWLVPMKLAKLIEGNTTFGKADGKIVREGGGTYATERSVGTIGDMTLVGCLRAF